MLFWFNDQAVIEVQHRRREHFAKLTAFLDEGPSLGLGVVDPVPL